MSSSTNPSAAPVITKYTLSAGPVPRKKAPGWTGVKRLVPLFAGEGGHVAWAFVGLAISSGANLVAPLLVGRSVDTYIQFKDSQGLVRSAILLLAVYAFGVAANYLQIRTM